jgi:hypothetical protein
LWLADGWSQILATATATLQPAIGVSAFDAIVQVDFFEFHFHFITFN